MYHSKRARKNTFNLKKHALNHNKIEIKKQRYEHAKISENKLTNMFSRKINRDSYNEFKINSKIHYNKFSYVRVIPKGNKMFIWFQKMNQYNSFIEPILFFENNQKNQGKYTLLNSKNNYNICCDIDTLGCGTNGTILYGTQFLYNDINYFNIENIYYYKNNNVQNISWNEKFNIINEIFTKYIKQLGYSKQDLLIISCLTQILPYDICSLKAMVPYEIHSLQYLMEDSKNIFFKQESVLQNSKQSKFYIKASLNHDEYDIYTIDNNKYVDKLYVPDYKTSVYLNGIFRNIRENQNLDLLEESDSEEDFQNIDLDKYVDLNKRILFSCIFDNNMKMWKLSSKNTHK